MFWGSFDFSSASGANGPGCFARIPSPVRTRGRNASCRRNERLCSCGSPTYTPGLARREARPESEASTLYSYSGSRRDVTTSGRLPETPAGGFSPARAQDSSTPFQRSEGGTVHLSRCSPEPARGKFLQPARGAPRPSRERGPSAQGASRAPVLPGAATAGPLSRTPELTHPGGGGLRCPGKRGPRSRGWAGPRPLASARGVSDSEGE